MCIFVINILQNQIVAKCLQRYHQSSSSSFICDSHIGLSLHWQHACVIVVFLTFQLLFIFIFWKFSNTINKKENSKNNPLSSITKSAVPFVTDLVSLKFLPIFFSLGCFFLSVKNFSWSRMYRWKCTGPKGCFLNFQKNTPPKEYPGTQCSLGLLPCSQLFISLLSSKSIEEFPPFLHIP